jgi:hypothetical protein
MNIIAADRPGSLVGFFDNGNTSGGRGNMEGVAAADHLPNGSVPMQSPRQWWCGSGRRGGGRRAPTYTLRTTRV